MSLKTQKNLSTPTKAPSAPVRDSPGTWRHPRLDEISKRLDATTFSEKNAKLAAYNLSAMVAFSAVMVLLREYVPFLANQTAMIYFHKGTLFLLLLNVLYACLPLLRKKDDLSDIPLTPGQRKLLGLPPSATPPTPGSVYSTPPRYSRTPSMSGSTSSKRTLSGSPLSNRASPINFGGSGGNSGSALGTSLGASGPPFSPTSSPLLQKAMNGARRSSFGSLGSSNPLGGSLGSSTATSIFGGLDSPSPSPANGKRSSVGLNNKWLYERGRRSSGNAWLHN